MFRALVSRRAAMAATAALMLAVPVSAFAQDYPSRPIRIIVQTAPGGLIDLLARTFAQKLTETTGKTAVVENKTGGGGVIAAEFVAKAPNDGYTVFMGTHSTQAILPHLRPNLPYAPQKDFVPVAYIATTPTVLIVHPSVKATTLKELIAHLKENPGKLNFASQGNGSTGHMGGEQFKQLAGVDVVHVPYRGAAPALKDLVAGHVAMMFDNVPFAREQVLAGKVRALGVVSPDRVSAIPNVPTMKEAGLPEMEGGPWFGLFVPAGTPRAVIDYLNAQANKIFALPEVRDNLIAQGFRLPLGTPEAFATHVATDSKRWGEVVRRGNIQLK